MQSRFVVKQRVVVYCDVSQPDFLAPVAGQMPTDQRKDGVPQSSKAIGDEEPAAWEQGVQFENRALGLVRMSEPRWIRRDISQPGPESGGHRGAGGARSELLPTHSNCRAFRRLITPVGPG